MTEQMTSIGAYVLCALIVVFWGAVAALVRLHRARSGGRPEGMP